jgi:hypothetical protein
MMLRFNPHFPDIIVAATSEDEITVWSSKTGRCLAKFRLPYEGFSSELTDVILSTTVDLESIDDTKKYGCSDARGLRVIATTADNNEKSNIYVFQLNLPHPDMYAQASKPDEASDEMIGSLELLAVHDIPMAYYTNSDVTDRLLFTAGRPGAESKSIYAYIYDLGTGECLFRSNKLGDLCKMKTASGIMLVRDKRDLFTIVDAYGFIEEDNSEDGEV